MKIRWQIAQWFELRWWKRYLHGKSKPEYLDWKTKYWLHLLAFISNEVKITPSSPLSFGEGLGVRTIADLGCGPAGIFISLPQNKVTAIDPLLSQYETATTFFKRSDYPNTTFIESGIEDFDPAEKFDLVFCMNAINHVNDIDKAFETLKKVTAPKGQIVLSIDAHNYTSLQYIFRLLPGDILHPHQYNLNGYRNLLAKDGWKVSVPYLLKQELLFNHYILIAKKAD